MPAKAQVVAERGVDVAGVAGVDGDSEWVQFFGEGDSQHAIGLFRLAIGLVVVVAAAFEFEVVDIQAAGPIAGDVNDARGSRLLESFAEGCGHPEIAQDIGGELHFDAFGGFQAAAGCYGGVVDQDVQTAVPAGSQIIDG